MDNCFRRTVTLCKLIIFQHYANRLRVGGDLS